MEPPPIRAGGPVLWLGGQKRRGIALAARFAEGWIMPGNRADDVDYFAERREAIRRALDAAGRDPSSFSFAAQVNTARDPERLRQGREVALRFLEVGADHITLGIPGREGPEALAEMAREVAEPVRDAAGRS